MVQQMVDEFSECRLVNSVTTMPSGEKQHPVSVKKVALRELPNETQNVICARPGNSPRAKNQGGNVDSIKMFGAKRQQPDCPLSPSIHQPVLTSNGTNGHLVYVRRKLETETGKLSPGHVDSAEETRKLGIGATEEQKMQEYQVQEPKASSFSVIPLVPVATLSTESGALPLPCPTGNFITVSAVPEPKRSLVTTAAPIPGDIQQSSSQNYWKERYLRLQKFLKNCDQSGQEEYIQKLRSLSAVGRSRHAFELEKRAIRLLLEEGMELERMQVLKVLGKALPRDHTPDTTETPLQADCLKAEKSADGLNKPFQGTDGSKTSSC